MFRDFTPAGRARVIAATKHVETMLRNDPPGRGRYAGDGGEEHWYQLAPGQILLPGQTKNAYRVLWNGTAYAADTTATIALRECAGLYHGLPGEWLRGRILGTADGPLFEVRSHGAAWYKGTLQGPLVYGGSATARLTIRGQTVDVTVHDGFLSAAGDELAADAPVGFHCEVYAAGGPRFEVTEARC